MKHKEYRKLHAEWYEYMSSGDHSQEIAYWTRNAEEAGQPVLELGSGTGKVLAALLAKGIDITGIDNSPDMIARCRDICRRKGLTADLHEQSMLDFTLPRKFRLVILPSGSLSLFTRDEDILSMCGRVMAHLEPGGVFIYGFEAPPAKPEPSNNNWTGGWVRGPDDVVIAWRQHRRSDAAKRIWEILFVVDKFVDGRLVESEANEREGRSFGIDEAVGYARATGFVDMNVIDRITEGPPRPDSTSLLVWCRKPMATTQVSP